MVDPNRDLCPELAGSIEIAKRDRTIALQKAVIEDKNDHLKRQATEIKLLNERLNYLEMKLLKQVEDSGRHESIFHRAQI